MPVRLPRAPFRVIRVSSSRRHVASRSSGCGPGLRVLAAFALLAGAACARLSHPSSITRASFAFPVDSFRATGVRKGATELFIYSRKGPWAIHVLDVRLDGCLDAVAVKGGTSAVGRVKTTALLAGLSRQRDVVAGVNADFFSLANGVPANVLVVDGRVLTPPSNQPAFAVDSSGAPHITAFASVGDAFAVDDPAFAHMTLAPFHPAQAVGGRPRLLRDSSVVPEVDTEGQPGFATGRHPRTAIGIANNGKRLVLAVVDGRRSAYSDGMTLRELANLMRALGARDALNLDGGGSTTMAVANTKTHTLHVVNRPSDPQGERAVGDALAIVACR